MKTTEDDLISGLPCEKRIRKGCEDVRHGRRSPEACLVRIAAPRLRRAGLISKDVVPGDEAELELYSILQKSNGDAAYSRYNALLQELVSFEMALDHRLRRRFESRNHPRDAPHGAVEPHGKV